LYRAGLSIRGHFRQLLSATFGTAGVFWKDEFLIQNWFGAWCRGRILDAAAVII
jgi:hypothetical protein